MATRRRRNYSPEERAARAAADDAIKHDGEALLTDPAAVSELITRLSTLTAPSLVCRYSLRNIALLETQAHARGMTLTDVGVFETWQARGRAVRKGETGLRIVAPKGRQQADTGADTDPGEWIMVAESHDTADTTETATRTRFRMISVFDISQTESIEDFDGEPVTVAPLSDPVAALRASLAAQLERVGYQLHTGDTLTLDHSARTVTTSEARTADELAQALAAITTLPPEQRPTLNTDTPRPRTSTPRPTAPADPSSIRLDLGKYADGFATIRTDEASGATFYTVTGSRISGTFTVAPQSALDSDRVRLVAISYGEADPRRPFESNYRRPDRPVINGIDLVGGSGGLDLDHLERIDGRRLYCRRPTNPDHDEAVPARTNDRAAAIVRAILAHYLTRDDLPALHRVTAAREAADMQRHHARNAAAAAEHIAKLQQQHAESAAAAARYAHIASNNDHLSSAS